MQIVYPVVWVLMFSVNFQLLNEENESIRIYFCNKEAKTDYTGVYVLIILIGDILYYRYYSYSYYLSTFAYIIF